MKKLQYHWFQKQKSVLIAINFVFLTVRSFNILCIEVDELKDEQPI